MPRIESVFRDGFYHYPTIKPITFQVGNNGSATDITLTSLRKNNPNSINYTKWECDIHTTTPLTDGAEKVATLHLHIPTNRHDEVLEALSDERNQRRLEWTFLSSVKGESLTRKINCQLAGSASEESFDASISITEPLKLGVYFQAKRLIILPPTQPIQFRDTLEPLS